MDGAGGVLGGANAHQDERATRVSGLGVVCGEPALQVDG